MRRLVAVLAATAFAFPLVAADAGDDTIWFRASESDDCGAKVYTLSLEAGPGESACGYIGGLPMDTVFEEGTSYSLSKGEAGWTVGSADVTGQLEIGHDAAGGGSYEVEIEVKINGKKVGSTVATAMTGNVGSSVIDFTLALDDAIVGQTVEKLSVSVLLGGQFVSSGFMQMDNSFINIARA